MLVLIPLTFDRLMSVAFPLKYDSIITHRVSWLMVIMSWTPTVVTGLWDAVNFKIGETKVTTITLLIFTYLIEHSII